MHRRLVAALVAVAVLGFAVMAVAASGKYGILVPSRAGDKSEVIYLTPGEAAALQGAPKSLSKISGTTGIIDTIYTDEANPRNVNFGFASNDTFAAYFKPPAACIIKAVGFNGHSWGSSPLSDGVSVSIRKALGYHVNTPPDSVDADGWLGYWDENGNWVHSSFMPTPPVGEMIWGDLPWTIDENAVEEVPMYYIMEPDVGEQDYFVILVPYGGPEGAYIGFDSGDVGSNYYARGLKYYQGSGTSGRPGWHVRHYGWWTYCIVEFYANTPPSIVGPSQIVSTYDANKEFKATATITDIDASDPNKAGVAEAYIVWTTGAGVDSAAMTNVEGNKWEGVITGVGVGDTVVYWVGAKDKGDPPLYAKSSSRTFIVGQRNPQADLLVVFQAPLNAGYYTDMLDENGYVYDVWDIASTYGIDASVTTAGYSSIVLAGWGCNTIPTRGYEGNAYAEFLQAGGKLFLSDMDYFYTNAEPGNRDTTFTAGDFAYDFFGLAGGVSDPTDADGNANLDSLFTGVEGDPISGDWATTPIAISWFGAANHRDWNWTDYVTAGNGTAIFKAESGHDVAVRYDNGFKTVFLAFNADAVSDTTGGEIKRSADFDKLMSNVYAWFGTQKSTGVAEQSGQVPTSYSLSQNYPNPFNPTTTIEFSLAKASKVQLSVYNMLGQKVATLVNGHRNAGHYKVTFDASDLPSGVYFYKLVAGDYQAIHKMVLTK